MTADVNAASGWMLLCLLLIVVVAKILLQAIRMMFCFPQPSRAERIKSWISEWNGDAETLLPTRAPCDLNSCYAEANQNIIQLRSL
ncbi:hypothetical protein BX070DRAFT_218884 [Coemansia spiralis]|nr:hypothetical protein BX070DRAFT_218884 [Coemansia spiralis]